MSTSQLLRPEQSGVFVAPPGLAAVRDAAARSECAWLEAKLYGVRDKAGFLVACARDLKFPPHFGANWDALADALGDFGWIDAKSYVITLKGVEAFARHAPDDWSTALEILRNAADEWRGRKHLFVVLLDHAPRNSGVATFSTARA